jgi:tetraacyldisaccharide 4'-kinase
VTKTALIELLEQAWYGDHWTGKVMAPLGWVWATAASLRRLAYMAGVIPPVDAGVPVIVVGNLTVGGTGKTPLVIWLARWLIEQGYRPGIVSRGHGGTATQRPQQVRPDSNPDLVGDEPVLVARRTGCPVAVCRRRAIAARELARHTECDILVCDDGLQHYALRRDLEIAVVDGDRRFGNGRCLPAGPLREPASRLRSVDMVVANSRAGRHEFLMEYEPQPLRALADESRRMDIEALRGRRVHAVAGIGNPARFFSYLRSRNVDIIRHQFPDHHRFSPADLDFGDDLPVVMTEKDAVKCTAFAGENFWYLPIEARMSPAFVHRLSLLLRELADGQETA